jgi:DNA-binding CsgD family transcriptional regulator
VIASVVGRERELAETARFLDSIESRFGVLLFAGPAGIGKTTLWAHAVAAARERGYRVLVARPTEVETGLAFAALNDLLGDVTIRQLEDLPEPQRIALEAALLRVPAETAPPPLAVSLGVGQVLRQAAALQPVVIAVDDVPWLDEPSARVLDFVLRRLDDEPVGVIAGRRTVRPEGKIAALDGVAPERITRLDLGELTLNETDRLLRERVGLDLPRPSLVRLRAVSGGNAFYALELGRAIAGGQATADLEAFSKGSGLDALVGTRLDRLGPDAETLSVHAAAASQPTVSLLEKAIGLEAVRAGLVEAERDGVLAIDGDKVRFSHPLLAAAAYARAPDERRRDAHRRLADVIAEPEERAVHLARASTRPDADVAAALDDAARAAAQRGAPEAAARSAERAADLTPAAERHARRERLAAAAQYQIAAGDIERGRRLLERLVEESLAPAERAEALARLAHLLLVQAEWDTARELYREAASIVDDDPGRRIPIEQGLAGVAYVTWQDWDDGARHAAEALRLAERLGDPVVLSQILGHAASWRGRLGEDWRVLMDRADALPDVGDGIPAVEHPDLQFARLLRDAGAFDDARRRIDRLVAYARKRGDWHGLPRLLLTKAGIDARSGDVASATATLDEATTGVYQTGEGAWMDDLNVLGHRLAALRGDVDEARRIEAAVDARLEANPTLAHERWSTAVSAAELDLALGDASAASRRLEPLLATADTDPLKPASACTLIVLAIEVLVAVGRIDDASALAEHWSPRLRMSGVPWIEADVERASAVLLAAKGEVEAALDASENAISLAEHAGIPLIEARALLTAGEVRRRARQKARAREALESAVAIFTRLGARLWAGRARAELARVAPKRPAGAPLTATEHRVVELVAAGRSNREIADALFMSVHTVEAHLTRLFRELDVHSRTELARLAIEGTDPRLHDASTDAGS